MPQSLHCSYAHIVFSTKNRERMLVPSIADRIHSYIAGMAQERGADMIAINGVPDHVHLLIRSSKNMPDAVFMKELKGGSSQWINDNNLVHGRFKWQAGYGWFSVSPKDTDQVVAYIRNQQKHHETISFQDEFRKFLAAYQVDYDERYVWD